MQQAEDLSCNEVVRKCVPLVHCITNYVTVNDVANAILACGGSPIMADDVDEVGEITGASNALVINIGTLNSRTIASMLKAGHTANEKGIPVVLDPVGAGASNLRNKTTLELLNQIHFAVIRGNLSELSFIAGRGASTRGVDSSAADGTDDAVSVAQAVAKRHGCIAVVTGAEDIVTDGRRLARIGNGVSEMGKITGTGCMLSGLIGAYAAACAGAGEDLMPWVVSAVISMGLAGELSWERSEHAGTGSLHIGIIDALCQIDDDTVKSRGKVTYEG